MPKLRAYLFISIIDLIFGIIIMFFKPTIDALSFTVAIGGGFVPFLSLANLAGLTMNPIPLSFIGIIIGIMGAIQLFVIAMIVLSTVSNLIWSPNV